MNNIHIINISIFRCMYRYFLYYMPAKDCKITMYLKKFAFRVVKSSLGRDTCKCEKVNCTCISHLPSRINIRTIVIAAFLITRYCFDFCRTLSVQELYSIIDLVVRLIMNFLVVRIGGWNLWWQVDVSKKDGDKINIEHLTCKYNCSL